MRGVQLGAAIGARVTSTPDPVDWARAEVVVLVKRAGRFWAETARRYGVPIVWDALDFWAQPDDNGCDASEAEGLLREQLAVIKPALTIGATKAMAEAAGGVYLPHHGRLGLVPTPARETVRFVGYDGDARYLGSWAPAIEAACQARGWTFVVNPPDLSAMDILVAFRDGEWDGWMNRQWKSGVKIVNAMHAGRPIITQESGAWHELKQSGAIVRAPSGVEAAFDAWAPCEMRDRVWEPQREQFTVEAIGRQYLNILATVARQGVSA